MKPRRKSKGQWEDEGGKVFNRQGSHWMKGMKGTCLLSSWRRMEREMWINTCTPWYWQNLCCSWLLRLVPVFELIIIHYSIKSGLMKVRAGKDCKAMQEMMTQYSITQYSLKAELKKFGEKSEAAVSKELGQLHDMSVFTPVDAKKLTRDQKAAALASLMFLKEKKYETVKVEHAQMAASKGRQWQKRTQHLQQSASNCCSWPAQSKLAKTDVAVMDLPGAFLHIDCDNNIIMTFVGILAELMVLASPKMYRKYVLVNSQGEPVQFVSLQKTLYGMLKLVFLFYKNLLTHLVANRITITPNDSFVVTKIIQGKQMTIFWHIDDLKVSPCVCKWSHKHWKMVEGTVW